MSNFIYNDNFNDDNYDKEPINFNFNDNKKSGVGVKSFVAISILCILTSAFFGIFGAYFFMQSAENTGVLSNSVDVTIEQSASNANKSPSLLSNGENVSIESVVAEVKDTVVVVTTPNGTGSGVVAGKFESKYKSGYYVITNVHVIEGAYSRNFSKIAVTHSNGSQYTAEVVGTNTASDVAVLKIYETEELKCAKFASDDYSLSVGEDVFAIGNSLGKFDGTVTKGSVSYGELRQVSIDGNVMSLIQLDISVYPGNSGGGLFNSSGELVGIVNAKVIDNDVGRIGFAIPHTEVLNVYLNCIKLSGN